MLLCIFACAFILVGAIYLTHYSEFSQHERIKNIFHKLVVQTGQSQNTPEFIILPSPEINAYTNGAQVVLFQGMIDFSQSDDEIALVLGHELAHVMLRHTSIEAHHNSDVETQVSEANADKLGAFYALKAGYSVCDGREMWKRMGETNGDYLGYDHPNYAYRYEQLNVNCD